MEEEVVFTPGFFSYFLRLLRVNLQNQVVTFISSLPGIIHSFTVHLPPVFQLDQPHSTSPPRVADGVERFSAA